MDRPTEAELQAWIEECVAHLRDAESFDVLSPHANEFLVVYGIAARTVRYADAYLLLIRSEHEPEAVALARAALEHAVTLQWIFLVQGGVDRFRVATAHERITHYSNLAAWLKSDELAEELTKLDPPPEGKQLPPFMDMVRNLDREKFLETSYHILSQQVHVTHAAVTGFIAPGEEDELHIQYDQEYGFQYQATYVTAAACMLARWVVARLTNDAAPTNTSSARHDSTSSARCHGYESSRSRLKSFRQWRENVSHPRRSRTSARR